jgi:hypothetical protein
VSLESQSRAPELVSDCAGVVVVVVVVVGVVRRRARWWLGAKAKSDAGC